MSKVMHTSSTNKLPPAATAAVDVNEAAPSAPTGPSVDVLMAEKRSPEPESKQAVGNFPMASNIKEPLTVDASKCPFKGGLTVLPSATDKMAPFSFKEQQPVQVDEKDAAKVAAKDVFW